MLDSAPLLAAVNLHKTYRKHAVQVPVLAGLDLETHAGEFLSVVGASGSGKSTLLHLLGTLDRPDEGRIYLEGRRIDNVPARERDALRNRTFGFIFQFYHLLPELTALENVLMPQMIEQSVFGWWSRRRVLLADEPTGNLDADTGADIVRLLRDLNRLDGLTIVMVTHNLELVGETDRVVRLVSGRVEEAQPSAAVAAGAG